MRLLEQSEKLIWKMLVYVFAIVSVVFLFLFLLERIEPLREPKHSLFKRLVVNFCVTALAFAVNTAVVQPSAEFMMNWTKQKSLGLIHIVPLPAALGSAIAFLLMDLTFYYWHRANHRFPLLWRFHNVHHIDLDLDVSTGFRFHFVEIALSAGFRIVQVALIGVSAWTYALYELAFQANTLFHHSNVRLPIWAERLRNSLRSIYICEGISFIPMSRSQGLSEIPSHSPIFGNVLMMPFQKQRDYWRRPDQTTVERNPKVLGEDPTHMVDGSGAYLQSTDEIDCLRNRLNLPG